MTSNTQTEVPASPKVSSTKLAVKYDGQALQTHEMDVKQLAPALLALAKVFDRTQEKVTPDARVSLNAKATKEGSFDIDLIVRVVNDAQSLFTSPMASALANAATIGGIVFGAIKIIKHASMHGGKPKVTKPAGTNTENLKLLEIEFQDGTKIKSLESSFEMTEDKDFIDSIKTTTAPTLEDGVDYVKFDMENHSEKITSEEADAIAHYSLSETDKSEDTIEVVIQALDPSFRDGGKWRITDGFKTQFVSLEDDAFKRRVLDGDEALRSNDIYRVLMKVEKGIGDAGRLTAKYISIMKVIEHKSAGEQPTLF